MSEEQAVLVDIADGVMTITLNRPKAKNAVNRAVAEGVAAAMDELDSNDDVRVAVITGAGGTFCSGMDLKAFVTGELPQVAGRGFAGLTEKPPRKPLIAAVGLCSRRRHGGSPNLRSHCRRRQLQVRYP